MFKEHAFSLLCRPYHIYNIQSPHTTLLLTDFYIFFIAISCFSSITDRTLHGEPLLSIAYEFTDSSAALHWVTRNIRSFILLTTSFIIKLLIFNVEACVRVNINCFCIIVYVYSQLLPYNTIYSYMNYGLNMLPSG